MSFGSQQLRRFRIARRDGATLEEAAAAGEMSLIEAEIHAKRDDADPPPPEAYVLIGHNQPPKEMNMAEVTDDRLRLLIERVERLEEEKKALTDDIRDVYAEAKAVGYDAKIMRQIVRLRKMSPDDRAEMEMLLDTYKCALGLDYSNTPLGQAAVRREEGGFRGAVSDYATHLSDMDAKGIGVSVRTNDGPEIPLNQAARDKMEAQADG